jgi:hypothetical protein
MSSSARFLLVPAVALASGCAAVPADSAAERPGAASPTEQRYTVSATVLESPDHGPQLCHAVATSYPPQCGGPDVIGWDWAAVDGEESANGTTWGVYRVVGTWDGERLTLAEPPGEPRHGEGWPGPDLSTPCPTPDGGWRIEDPATATPGGRQAAIDYANRQPGLGSVWLDNGAELADHLPGVAEQAVLNVSFTGDVQRHEAELRARYGGPLCVVPAAHSQAELSALQERVNEALRGEMLSSAPDGIRGRVQVVVPFVDQEVRDRVAQVDPDGLVELQGWLQPVG